jgi:hypothetical protein
LVPAVVESAKEIVLVLDSINSNHSHRSNACLLKHDAVFI